MHLPWPFCQRIWPYSWLAVTSSNRGWNWVHCRTLVHFHWLKRMQNVCKTLEHANDNDFSHFCEKWLWTGLELNVVILKIPRPNQLWIWLFGMSSDASLIYTEHFLGENCVRKLRMKGEILCVKKISFSQEKTLLKNKCKFAWKKTSLGSPNSRESSDALWSNSLRFKYANGFFPQPSVSIKIRHFHRRFSSKATPLGGAV